MEDEQKITITLRASQFAQLNRIRVQLLAQLKEKDDENYLYLERLSLDNLATICFTLGLSSKSLIAKLERIIWLHALFNNIQNKKHIVDINNN